MAHITVMLRQIRSVHRSLTPDALLTLLHALVITKLDFCCSTLPGVSGTLLQITVCAECRRLTSVLGKEIGTQLLFSGNFAG